jgi:uncharacterized membrane protein
MTKIEKSIFIRFPVKEVFEYASDWERWEDWFEGVSDFRPVTETKKGNGTRYAYRAKMMGLTVKIETEVHDYVEDKGWTGKATKGMPHQTQWIFESANGGTKLTYVLEYNLALPLLGPIFDRLFMKPQWEQLLEKSLQNLAGKFQKKEI